MPDTHNNASRLAIFTSTRADYGLLRWLFSALQARPDTEPLWLITGTHLEKAFGATVSEIHRDGGTILDKIALDMQGKDSGMISRAAARLIRTMANHMDDWHLDGMVVLGDRIEALAAAMTAYTFQLPVIHLHGGELSRGALDDGYRHAITKLSALHFTAAQNYRNRVLQLGEPPQYVFHTGALVNDALAAVPHMTRSELERQIGHPLTRPLFLVTVHPETAHDNKPDALVSDMVHAMKEFTTATIIWTYANADAGGQAINARIKALTCDDPRFVVRPSLGQTIYVNMMRIADAVIGNSSSGIIEAPLVPVASIDIGMRQADRLRAPSVLHVEQDTTAIRNAIIQVLSPEYKNKLQPQQSPYCGQDVARHMAELIAKHLPRLPKSKPFYNLPANRTASS